jgi:site-specific DNA-cytosine methylase
MSALSVELCAGIGAASGALGYRCALAVDIDSLKTKWFAKNHPGVRVVTADVASLTEIPDCGIVPMGTPCVDISCAGPRGGFEAKGGRSAVFFPALKLASGCDTILFENVLDIARLAGGRNLDLVFEAFARAGYSFMPATIDAARFVPMARTYALATRRPIPAGLISPTPMPWCADKALIDAYGRSTVKDAWVWPRLPEPPARTSHLGEFMDATAPFETTRHAERMDQIDNAGLMEAAIAAPATTWLLGDVHMRAGKQRMELHAICPAIRTAAGGNSTPFVFCIEGGRVRSRKLLAREAAALMGFPRDFKLPATHTEGFKIVGDAMSWDVIRYLGRHLIDAVLA